jgi:hypothetical protein
MSACAFTRAPRQPEYIRESHNIQCSAGYLAKLASVGGGPAFRYLNDHWPVYDKAEKSFAN